MGYKMDVIVIDNFLSVIDFDRLKLGMLGDAEFPWYFSNGVVSPTDHTDFLTNYQFTHLFYDKYKPNSEYYPYLESILNKLDPRAIIRIKANLNPVTAEIVTYPFHIDYPDCKTAIFYLNTNNGYTIIEGEKIKSVENRIVIFDSNLTHTGTTCTDQKYRCLINFNYYE